VALAVYRRREPQKTVLYQVLQEHWSAFLAKCDEADRCVPSFVRKEIESFLDCGVLERGFARAVCACGFERLVPLSCGRRAFCPSCCGRRMNDLAAHLVDRVFPTTPTRQWVLSLPHALRYLLAYDADLCTQVLRIFVAEVFKWYKRTAKEQLGLASVKQAHCGSVTAIQRAGSSVNLNLHFHQLACDGVFVQQHEDDTPAFHAMPAPSAPEISQIAWQTCLRTKKLLDRLGKGFDVSPDEVDGLLRQEPLLADCAASSMMDTTLFGNRAGQRTLKLRDAPVLTNESARPRAAHGFDIHAKVRIRADDRKGLERLCRYIGRPPISHDRLTRRSTGEVQVRLKRPWSDGTSQIVLSPSTFISRLVALVPPPRRNQVRYFGVFAPRSKLRHLIVPHVEDDVQPQQLELFEHLCNVRGILGPDVLPNNGVTKPQYRRRWAQLLSRVLDIEALDCPHCPRKLRIVAFVTEPRAITSILRAQGFSSQTTVLHPARAPPQLTLPFRTGAVHQQKSA